MDRKQSITSLIKSVETQIDENITEQQRALEIQREQERKRAFKKARTVTNDDYLLGPRNMLMAFGFVISAETYMRRDNMSKAEAIEFVKANYKVLKDENKKQDPEWKQHKRVKRMTKELIPYNKCRCKIKDFEELMKD